MKHGIRGIPLAEGCLLLFIFVYAFAPFPSQCCVEEDGWFKLQEACDVESFVCLGLFIALPFPVYVYFVFLKYFLFLRQRRKGGNMEFLNVLG